VYEGEFMKKKWAFLSALNSAYLLCFILISLFYFLSLKQGNGGINFHFLGGGDDGQYYWSQALRVADGEHVVLTSIYPAIIGYLIKFFGIKDVIVVRFFNFLGFVLLTIVSLLVIKKIYAYRKLESQISIDGFYTSGILLLLCYCLYASLLSYTSISIYRDIWIYAIYVLSLYLSLKILIEKKYISIFFLIPVLVLLGGLRGYALISFIVSVAMCLLLAKVTVMKKRVISFILLTLIFGIYYTFFMDFRVPYINMSLRDALSYRFNGQTFFSGGSQMGIKLDESSFPKFLLNYVYSYVSNMLGPLPWQINGISSIVTFAIESCPMTIILLYIWKNRKLITPIMKYILIHSFVWIGFISVSNDNVGTATRLRVIGWILILIVFVCLYYIKKEKRTT